MNYSDWRSQYHHLSDSSVVVDDSMIGVKGFIGLINRRGASVSGKVLMTEASIAYLSVHSMILQLLNPETYRSDDSWHSTGATVWPTVTASTSDCLLLLTIEPD